LEQVLLLASMWVGRLPEIDEDPVVHPHGILGFDPQPEQAEVVEVDVDRFGADQLDAATHYQGTLSVTPRPGRLETQTYLAVSLKAWIVNPVEASCAPSTTWPPVCPNRSSGMPAWRMASVPMAKKPGLTVCRQLPLGITRPN